MTYVIVGASAGVGRALATRFAAAGHDLVLVASDERDLRATAADLAIRHGVSTRWVAADAGSDRRCAERIAAAALELGGLDGVLFPIGAVSPADDVSFDADRTARLFDVNFGAVAAIATRLLPQLSARPRAAIVGFGSVAATRGRGKNVAYAAAKRALASFFESLRHACADTGVAVQFYVLGYMDTELAADIRSPIPKGDPQALGDLVLRNLDRNVGVVYYPWFWRVLCVALRAAPWTLFKRLRL
jgi:short-subunit dehydrogenase